MSSATSVSRAASPSGGRVRRAAPARRARRRTPRAPATPGAPGPTRPGSPRPRPRSGPRGRRPAPPGRRGSAPPPSRRVAAASARRAPRSDPCAAALTSRPADVLLLPAPRVLVFLGELGGAGPDPRLFLAGLGQPPLQRGLRLAQRVAGGLHGAAALGRDLRLGAPVGQLLGGAHRERARLGQRRRQRGDALVRHALLLGVGALLLLDRPCGRRRTPTPARPARAAPRRPCRPRAAAGRVPTAAPPAARRRPAGGPGPRAPRRAGEAARRRLRRRSARRRSSFASASCIARFASTRRPRRSSSSRRCAKSPAAADGPATRTTGPRTTSPLRVTNVPAGCFSERARASASVSTNAAPGRAARSAIESFPNPSSTASHPRASAGGEATASFFQSSRTTRPAATERRASTARTMLPEARSASASVPSTSPTAISQPDCGRIRSESAPRSETPAPRSASRTALTETSRARSSSTSAACRCSSDPADSRASSRAASAFESSAASAASSASAARTRAVASSADACRRAASDSASAASASRWVSSSRTFFAACDSRASDAATRSAARSISWRALRLATRSPAAARARLRVSSSSFSSPAQSAAASEARRSASSRACDLARASATLRDRRSSSSASSRLARACSALKSCPSRSSAALRAARSTTARRLDSWSASSRAMADSRAASSSRRASRAAAASVAFEAGRGELGLGAGQGRGGLGLPGAAVLPQGLGGPERFPQRVPARPRQRRAAPAEQLGLFLVARGPRRLAAEAGDVLLDLRHDVGDPQQVPARLLELGLGQALAELVLGDPGGLLDQAAAVLGLGGEDLIDAALLDDRVRANPQPRPEQLVLDVAQANLLVVQEVLALAVPVDPPAHAEHALLVAALAVAVGSGKGQDDLGHPERAPFGGAVEDDVVHLLAAQGLGALLAQGPGHGVADVGFPAAVGPHDRGHGARKREIYLVVEGLKAGDLDAFETEHSWGKGNKWTSCRSYNLLGLANSRPPIAGRQAVG